MDQVDDSGGYWDIKYHNYCSVCPDSNSRVAKHKPTNCLGPRPFVLGVAKLATASAVGGACTVGPETTKQPKSSKGGTREIEQSPRAFFATKNCGDIMSQSNYES